MQISSAPLLAASWLSFNIVFIIEDRGRQEGRERGTS